MNGYCFEQYLIDNCSPTLASLKTANLFNYRYSSTDELNKAVERWNKELSGKGITVTVLRKRENTALIYVYLEMLSDLLITREKTADARAVGRYTATSARLCAPLRDSTSAELSTKRCGQTAGVSCSLRLHNIKNIRMKGFLL